MKGVQVYVYGVLDNERQIIYVGKTSNPTYRLSCHKRDFDTEVTGLKILDIFYDRENYWIHKLLKEGYSLLNKEISTVVENYKIGDIVEIGEKKKFKVRNTETGEIFSSAYKACNSYNKMSYETFRIYLDSNIKVQSRIYTDPFPFEII